MTTPLYLLLIPFIACADRFWGGGLTYRPGGVGLGKPFSLLLLPLCLVIGLPLVLAVGFTLAFIAWRSPAWRTFGGDLAPHRDRYLGTLLRHTIAPVAFTLAFAVWKQGFDPHFLLTLAFPPIALLLAIYMRQQSDKGRDVGATVEIVRGASLGALVAGVLSWVY